MPLPDDWPLRVGRRIQVDRFCGPSVPRTGWRGAPANAVVQNVSNVAGVCSLPSTAGFGGQPRRCVVPLPRTQQAKDALTSGGYWPYIAEACPSGYIGFFDRCRALRSRTRQAESRRCCPRPLAIAFDPYSGVANSTCSWKVGQLLYSCGSRPFRFRRTPSFIDHLRPVHQ